MSSSCRQGLTCRVIDLHPPAQRVIGLVNSVHDSGLGQPTPCPAASVGDLIDHIGVFAARFTGAARKDSSGPPSPVPPPSGANLEADWRPRLSRDLLALADAWLDPQAWEGSTFAGGREMPADVVGLVALDELIVHGWDIEWQLRNATSRRHTNSRLRRAS